MEKEKAHLRSSKYNVQIEYKNKEDLLETIKDLIKNLKRMAKIEKFHNNKKETKTD
jgi:hypothetical protein